MLDIFLVTARPEAMPAFIQGLSSDTEVRLKQFNSGGAALDAVRNAAPHLVIVDAELPDSSPLDLVQQLLFINAMVNTAVISPLSDSDFHEFSEGLGILKNLPIAPDAGDAASLLLKLRQILGL
jgi:DNA-binding NarL/FixJ family response regulator